MFHLFEFVLSETIKILLSPILLMNVFYNQFLKKYVAFHIPGGLWYTGTLRVKVKILGYWLP
jgi:hypothetical protein